MASKILYTKGAKVWLKHPVEIWKMGYVADNFKEGSIKVRTDSGEVVEIIIKKDDDLPPLKNPEHLVGGNDLTSMSYLHEPAVLHSLRIRFVDRHMVYTYCGIVLVCMNPYAKVTIYGEDTIQLYRKAGANGMLDPHIFAVAEKAFSEMERENLDQSIVISGESGAGKTVTAKLAMRYFAVAAGSSSETQVEKKVLASSPILEAIGNAKTTRNDNSSRFGKYSELGFNRSFEIQGAGMRTYLLEKSRVVFQAEAERNYHIFYQLCAVSKLPEMAYLQLRDQSEFYYTRQGNCAVIKNIDDMAEFRETVKSLKMLGFSEKQQLEFFAIVAAVLHSGNINIADAARDTCTIEPDDRALKSYCELLGLSNESLEKLRKFFCYRELVSMRERISKPMTSSQAGQFRDALAKHIYALLFSHMVILINRELGADLKPYRFIGVLDIYGFETFEINSFEQFCINYANEKLQQQFNHHVFKLEQEEYVLEKIEWKFIDYYDNQPCIELIEANMGIFGLLDEECRMPRGSDQSWVDKLYVKCKPYKNFEKPRTSVTAFIIVHFADRVQYESAGFLEKNRDTVLEDQVEVLRTTNNELLLELIKKKEEGETKTAKKQQTVGVQFRESLVQLVDTLNSTTPHYIRCIKPNDKKAKYTMNNTRAMQQLRACGVLETVRISSAGFPSRQKYPDFLARFQILLELDARKVPPAQVQDLCKNYLRSAIPDEDKYKFGITQIFFRAGQVAFLEKRRQDKFNEYGLILQKFFRAWRSRETYKTFYRGIVVGQCLLRGYAIRCKVQKLREAKAAVIVRRAVRNYAIRQKMYKLRATITRIQSLARGIITRKNVIKAQSNTKVLVLQKMIRAYLVRKHYLEEIAKRQEEALREAERERERKAAAEEELEKKKAEAERLERKKKADADRKRDKEQREKAKSMLFEDDAEHPEEYHTVVQGYKEVEEELRSLRERCVKSGQITMGGSEDQESEVLQVFETQKNIIRDLEEQLEEGKKTSSATIDKLIEDNSRYAQENGKLQSVLEEIGQKASPEEQAEAAMRYEITRLTTDNLDLRLQVEVLGLQLKKSQMQLKIAGEKILVVGDHPSDARKNSYKYLGMFEFALGDEKEILRNLVYDLKPRVASTLLPGLPAFVIFMCIRHADYINSDKKMRVFLSRTINAIRKFIIRRYHDLDTSVMWLVNTCQLLHNLKQYSGDKDYQEQNTEKQNEQCLRNFDLSEYQIVLSDIGLWIYQVIIKTMEGRIEKLIVKAVLEYESVTGLATKRGRKYAKNLKVDPHEAIALLLRELTIFHQVLQLYSVDTILVAQAFRQLFYFVGGIALNNLLQRKELCNWSKGIQIRYNLSHFEQWVRDQHINVPDVDIVDSLQPLIQVTRLLQVKKSDEDVEHLCTMCSRLTRAQVIHVLNTYEEPGGEDAESEPEIIADSFIQSVETELLKRNETDPDRLAMDVRLAYIVDFPFTPSAVRLEDIDIPPMINLSMLRKV